MSEFIALPCVAPLPADEAQRRRALVELDVLDSPPEQEFDALVKAAALVCGVPISLVSLVDSERQWFKANVGLPGVTQTPREVAFCSHAILEEGLFEVPDATGDHRFSDNPLVRGAPDIRFYAGVTLRLGDGAHVGTLCVIDRQPRRLTDLQRQVLTHLATAAVHALETRRLARERHRSEARFRALSETAPAGVFAATDTGECVYSNARWESIFGLDRAALAGRGWWQGIHAQDIEAVRERWRRAALTRSDFEMDFRVARPDGAVLQVRCAARPALGVDGDSDGLVGVLEDITARLQTQQALESERQRLAWILESTGAGTWQWNIQTGETLLNERWAELLGRTLASLQPISIDTWTSLICPDDLAAAQGLLARHFAGHDAVYECEFRMRHRSGHWVWVLARGRVLTRTADDLPEWMFGTHTDITPRKLQEEALRKSEDLLDRTGRLAGVGGWEIDVLSGELRWSDETRHLHGVQPGYTPTLESALNFYAPEARPLIQAAVDRALASGEAWDLEVPLLRADGKRIWARAVGAAEFSEGRAVRLVGAFQDVSERHAMDEVLAHKTSELKRSNEELERFAYVASHDLQEPLRMVTSYGQLLQRRHLADLKPEAQEFMRYMIDGGQRAQALIRDLLSLARLDSQARPWQPVALEALLAEALQPLQLRLRDGQARVTHDPLPVVVGDARQLGQLLGNLVGNALKFSGQAPALVHVAASREAQAWRISVSDQGIGIEQRYFERIFQMFQRLHQRSEYEGTGIGLTICKKVVERHGGRIHVESMPGQGSTFSFTLPDHAWQPDVRNLPHGTAAPATPPAGAA